MWRGIFCLLQEWEQARKEETAELERKRQLEAEVEAEKEEGYRNIGQQMKNYPAEDVKNARKLVASLIKAGEEVEEVWSQSDFEDEVYSPLNWIFDKNLFPSLSVLYKSNSD